MKLSYRHTIRTCYLGYVVGAIVNNFTPLLLTTFAAEFSLSVTQLGTLVVLNFAIQMFIDFTGAYIAEKTGYRAGYRLGAAVCCGRADRGWACCRT